jgi:hypothetical protein
LRLDPAAKQRARRPAPGFVAVARSGRSDTAQRHEELVFARLEPPSCCPDSRFPHVK